MPSRAKFIRADHPVDQELTAKALTRISDWLDLADDQAVTTVYHTLDANIHPGDSATAWMWAALIIADTYDIPSANLRLIANSIFKGVQGEFPSA